MHNLLSCVTGPQSDMVSAAYFVFTTYLQETREHFLTLGRYTMVLTMVLSSWNSAAIMDILEMLVVDESLAMITLILLSFFPNEKPFSWRGGVAGTDPWEGCQVSFQSIKLEDAYSRVTHTSLSYSYFIRDHFTIFANFYNEKPQWNLLPVEHNSTKVP